MPPKVRSRKRSNGVSKFGSISYASDEEPIAAAVERFASDPALVQQMPDAYPYESAETGSTRDTSVRVVREEVVRQEAMAPEVTKSIMDGLSTLQDTCGSLHDSYGLLKDNYGSLRDMLAFQEKLTRKILERQDELEQALNAKLDEGVPIKLPGGDDIDIQVSDRDEAVKMMSAGSISGEGVEQSKTPTLAWAPQATGQVPAQVKTNRFYAETSIKPTVHHSLLHQVVESKYFEYCSAFIILTHSIFIAYYVEYVATINFDGHFALTLINLILTLVFLGEVVIKIIVERQEYFFGCERRWNWFDMMLIFLVVMQLALTAFLVGKNKKKMKTVLKIAEMARTARILRIFRFLRFCPTLQVIIFKIFRSIRALSWVMALMFLCIWVVAVCFTQGANDFLAGKQLDSATILNEHEQGLVKHFGSMGKSMKTCFASISGGVEWLEIYSELEDVGAAYSFIFALYIFAFSFAFLNIITGIFMNDMHKADIDFEREVVEKKMEVQHIHLAEMFESMDNENGNISLEEFVNMAQHPVIQEYLQAVGIAQEDAHMLFYLLDEDGSGEITIREFLNGSHALTTASTGMDMKVILYESRHMRGTFTAGMSHLDQDLDEIRECVDELQNKLSFLSPAKRGEKKSLCRKTCAKGGRQTVTDGCKRPVPCRVANLARGVTKGAGGANPLEGYVTSSEAMQQKFSKSKSKARLLSSDTLGAL